MHLLIIWTKDLMKKNLDSYDHETKSGLVIKNGAFCCKIKGKGFL